MSLSWRDHLLAELAPHALRLRRLKPRWRGGRQLAEASLSCPADGTGTGDPQWTPVLTTLGTALADRSWDGARATVVLSNHFVHYLTIPWDEQLVTAEEQLAMVRHAFAQAYGSAADGWSLRWNTAPLPAPCLASAIDSALLEALRAVFGSAAIPLASIQPQLMATFNAHREALPDKDDYWFLDQESGRLCLVRVHADAPHALYSQRVGDDWLAELPAVLERGRLLGGADSAPGRVYLHQTIACEVAAEPAPGWSLHPLGAARTATY